LLVWRHVVFPAVFYRVARLLGTFPIRHAYALIAPRRRLSLREASPNTHHGRALTLPGRDRAKSIEPRMPRMSAMAKNLGTSLVPRNRTELAREFSPGLGIHRQHRTYGIGNVCQVSNFLSFPRARLLPRNGFSTLLFRRTWSDQRLMRRATISGRRDSKCFETGAPIICITVPEGQSSRRFPNFSQARAT